MAGVCELRRGLKDLDSKFERFVVPALFSLGMAEFLLIPLPEGGAGIEFLCSEEIVGVVAVFRSVPLQL